MQGEQINQNEEQQWEDEQEVGQESEQVQQVQAEQAKPLHSCQHYHRNCVVQAPCCKIFYGCKLCHDQKYQYKKGCQIQRMAFDKVGKIKCLECQLVQQPSINCQNLKCNIKFGEYTCLKCKLYQNNPKKVNDIFHCDDCKMCRRGKVQQFFHCHKCGYCRHISQKNKHKCNENVAQSACPVCLQILKYSLKPYIGLNCGHLIHLQCQAMHYELNCPVCGMAKRNLSEAQNKNIQKQIQLTKDKIPQQLKDKKVDVLCNECLHKTLQAPFHFYGIKCQKCGTYNTKMM